MHFYSQFWDNVPVFDMPVLNHCVTDIAVKPLCIQPWTLLNDEMICYSICQTPIECGISTELILGARIAWSAQWYGWGLDDLEFESRQERNSLCSKMSKLALYWDNCTSFIEHMFPVILASSRWNNRSHICWQPLLFPARVIHSVLCETYA